MLDIEARFKKDYIKILENSDYNDIEIIKRGFVIPSKIKKNSILFIGLNPSYTEPDKIEQRLPQFYNLYDENPANYYKPFNEISQNVNYKWAHIDLLALRVTNQTSVKKIIKNNIGKSLISDNLDIAKKMIESTNPKVIVVSNTLARTFLGKIYNHKKNIWLDYNYNFDSNLGTDRIVSTNPKLNNTPVFFY